MHIEKSGHGSWAVHVEPAEMAMDAAGRQVPRTALVIGTIDESGKIRMRSVPRGFKPIAQIRLEDARRKLYERGSIFERGPVLARKEERKEGSFIARTTNPKFAENRFHEYSRAARWVERVLRLSPNGTVAGYFRAPIPGHPSDLDHTPIRVEYKNEYGHVKGGDFSMWPGAKGWTKSGSPKIRKNFLKPGDCPFVEVFIHAAKTKPIVWRASAIRAAWPMLTASQWDLLKKGGAVHIYGPGGRTSLTGCQTAKGPSGSPKKRGKKNPVAKFVSKVTRAVKKAFK